MNALQQLIKHGQSYWLDNLSRGMIRSGELEKRVKEQGLRGITSNPTIFNKAISESDDYDDQIEQLVADGKAIHEIYEELTVKDVQDACDILRPVFYESSSMDGFVSLEVSPYLAHDTEGTVEEVRRLFKAVGRPNLFIKIPGTPAGVPAIEQMLYEGININITLLFSIESYEAVAWAYIRALERRLKENDPVSSVASVASFFLSRIDVLVDEFLSQKIRPEQSSNGTPGAAQLLGKVAVANAKLAYQRFGKIFSGERWQRLAEKGARIQRPLWASTSTKNPLYSDVKYVEPLIGPNTVNTMPASTIAAFADHGKIIDNSVAQDVEEAERIFADLQKLGVDLQQVTGHLIKEGVEKFIKPYDALMATLTQKREKLLQSDAVSQSFSIGDLQGKLSAACDEMDAIQFSRRLYAKDPFLWKSEPEHIELIRKRLGWLDCVADFNDRINEISDFAANIKQGYTHVVLLGMGGSSLSAEVARHFLPAKKDWPGLLILDKTDPATVRAIEAAIDPTSTLFIVASKSGTTSETLSFYHYFYHKLQKHFGEETGKHFIAITDPGTPLVTEAQDKKFRRVFENPPNIGGRYSALSYFGLVPMALSGIGIGRLLEHARTMAISCGPAVPARVNPGVRLGVLLGMAQRDGRDKVTFVLSESVRAFGDWAEQLLAESTGKEGRGLVPIVNEPLGLPEVYNDDRLFVSVCLAGEEKQNQRELKMLDDAGHPVVRIVLNEPSQLGAEFLHWEIAAAAAGAVMGINPFDEPNVAESKKNTGDFLDAWQKTRSFDNGNVLLQENGATVYCSDDSEWLTRVNADSFRQFLKSFVKLAEPHNYVALLPYFMQTQARDKALQELRQVVRDRFGVATSVGYGPRYLHSTGQLHKGGPKGGLYILLTADTNDKADIPEKPYDFETLQRAQVLGDFKALADKKQPVVRIHLSEDVNAALNGIRKTLAKL